MMVLNLVLAEGLRASRRVANDEDLKAEDLQALGVGQALLMKKTTDFELNKLDKLHRLSLDIGGSKLRAYESRLSCFPHPHKRLLLKGKLSWRRIK